MKDLKDRWVLIKKEYPNCVSMNTFIAQSFCIETCIENVFVPVFICGKKVQFTNYVFTNNGNGKEYFLILVNNKYKFLEFAYEPDCDGAYYTHYIVNIFDIREGYSVYSNVNSRDVYNVILKCY